MVLRFVAVIKFFQLLSLTLWKINDFQKGISFLLERFANLRQIY